MIEPRTANCGSRLPLLAHRLRQVTLAALVCALVAPAAGASPAAQTGVRANPPATAIGWLNAQREAHGIPAGIVENPDWSRACDRHISYWQATNTLGHEEDPSNPHYSEEGNWGGTHAVLSYGDTWLADANPWEWAPIHLAQLLAPELTEIGVADRGGMVCATTWPGYSRELPVTTSVVTYPGDGTKLYAREKAYESPFTPGDLVGLPQGTETGPHLYVYVWGPALADYRLMRSLSIAHASLRGPRGELTLRWVDHTTARIGPYLPSGSGIIIPVEPLQVGTRYDASVRFSDGTSHSWSFDTELLENAIEITANRYRGGQVWIRVSSNAPNAKLTLRYRGRPLKVKVRVEAEGGLSVLSSSKKVPRGTVACVTSGGAPTEYEQTQTCKKIK